MVAAPVGRERQRSVLCSAAAGGAFAVCLLSAGPARAFNYAEHRDIACEALSGICREQVQSIKATDWTSSLCTFHCQILPALSVLRRADAPMSCVGFADLVALAGDHTKSPLDLLESSCVDLHQLSTSVRQYLQLAEDNASHFFPEAKHVYNYWHRQARANARVARIRSDRDLLDEALTYEAFALHFLTDLYSAGHRRVDRNALHDYAARRIHDQDSQRGLLTVSHHLYKGDGNLERGNCEPGRPATSPQWCDVIRTVTASLCEVLSDADPSASKRVKECGLGLSVEEPLYAPLKEPTAYDATVALRMEGRTLMEARVQYAAATALFLEAPLPPLPWLAVAVQYLPTMFVNRGPDGTFFRHDTVVVHQLAAGLTARTRHPAFDNMDMVVEALMPINVGSQAPDPWPTASFGFDYWLYRLTVGLRGGGASFRSPDDGSRYSFWVGLGLGWGFR